MTRRLRSGKGTRWRRCRCWSPYCRGRTLYVATATFGPLPRWCSFRCAEARAEASA